MGFLDEWSRRASQRRAGKVDFLGEQSGIVEETLKRELILEFATRPDIQRAYLASVSFPPATDPSSVLCVVSRRPDDRSLILRVAEIFRRRFSREPTLDIIFLTAEQESELAALCAPFYGRPIAS